MACARNYILPVPLYVRFIIHKEVAFTPDCLCCAGGFAAIISS